MSEIRRISSSASTPTLVHERAQKQLFRPFPTPLTWKQWGYILGMQGVAAMLIDAGANFGIAYAMYHAQSDVRMWVFAKNTIAGDLGVTPIIQTAMSMLITSTLVHTDLHNGMIPPLPFVYPHVEHLPDPRILLDRVFRRKLHTADQDELDEKTEAQKRGGISFYFWMAIRFIFEGTERNMLLANVGFKNWWGRLLWTGLQGAGLGIILGFPLWCLAIVILGPIYKLDNMGGKWAPEAIKGVYGGLYGLYSNPIIAMIALGAQSEHHLLVVPIDEEASIEIDEDGVPTLPIHTIREEEDGESAPPSGSVTPTPAGRSGPPSPFLRPSRIASTGHSTPAHFRVGEGANNATSTSPGLAPPSPLRRVRSSSISRPPLTCNVAALPTPEAATTPRPTRPRGLTVSSYISTTSGTSFTYALGGTGGRACRSRSNTTTSIPFTSPSGQPSPSASSRLNIPPSPLPQPSFKRDRSNSAAARTSSRRPSDLDRGTPTSSDVFGPASSTSGTQASYATAGSNSGAPSLSSAPALPPLSVPELTVQRPSMDVESEQREREGATHPLNPLERVAGDR